MKENKDKWKHNEPKIPLCPECDEPLEEINGTGRLTTYSEYVSFRMRNDKYEEIDSEGADIYDINDDDMEYECRECGASIPWDIISKWM